MRISIISGSHRHNSQSERVANYIHGLLDASGISSEVISLAGNPIPLWDEEVWSKGDKWREAWSPIAKKLDDSSGFVLVSPEWAGMVPPGLKNFLLLCSTREVGHKPALIVSVSSGVGGSYPVAELRSSSYKNNRLVYIPEHVIIRDVEAMLKDGDAQSDRDVAIRARIQYALNVLIQYSHSLLAVRESGTINYKDFPYGM